MGGLSVQEGRAKIFSSGFRSGNADGGPAFGRQPKGFTLDHDFTEDNHEHTLVRSLACGLRYGSDACPRRRRQPRCPAPAADPLCRDDSVAGGHRGAKSETLSGAVASPGTLRGDAGFRGCAGRRSLAVRGTNSEHIAGRVICEEASRDVKGAAATERT